MPLRFPPLNDVHFAVLEIIEDKTPGNVVRERLEALGYEAKLPTFYQMMKGLETKGLVIGEYAMIDVAGHRVRERRYSLTAKGKTAFDDTSRYYQELTAYKAARNPGLAGI